jgi:cysteinyl-tRNA synthetase
MKYLGNNFDIHTGGIDHIPVHHTNEIAQSEAATGKKFVNYWLHGAFLTSKGKKISKSKGGLYTISELEEKEFKPLSYKLFTFTAHYRSPLNFDLKILESAQNSYDRLKNIISDLKDDNKLNKTYLKKFENAINNDLDMPSALSSLWQLIRDKKAQGKIKTIKEMDKVFGLDLLKKEISKISDNVKNLIKEREVARKEKDFKKADKIRDKLREQGIILEDTKEGVKWKLSKQ